MWHCARIHHAKTSLEKRNDEARTAVSDLRARTLYRGGLAGLYKGSQSTWTLKEGTVKGAMYKLASKSLQRAVGRDTSRRLRAYAPRTRAEMRKWWYPVIQHHDHHGTSVAVAYGKKFPAWLNAEITRFTSAKWLIYWDRKTGARSRRNTPA